MSVKVRYRVVYIDLTELREFLTILISTLLVMYQCGTLSASLSELLT